MRFKLIALVIVSYLMFNGVGGFAQAAQSGQAVSGGQPPPPKPPLYSALFSRTTHNNGYEEWVQAADLIQNDANVAAFFENLNATLAEKRRVLAIPAVRQALILVRMGLDKPVFSPRTNIDQNTTMPELLPLRQIGRLLGVEMYVQFAEGRVDAALSTFRTGLAFGYRVQTDTIINGLVGVAIDAIVIREFSRHLDQLSVYHCDEVRRMMEEFLKAENPALHLFQLEKQYDLDMLGAHRTDAQGLLTFLKSLENTNDGEENAELTTVRTYLTDHPGEVTRVVDDAQSHITALYDRAVLNMQLPVSQRTPLTTKAADSPGAVLSRLLTADPKQIENKYTLTQVRLRTIALHALIHRYRWDHETLPNSLADLKAPKLVKDPLSEIEIKYTRDGDHYTLEAPSP